MKKTGGFFETSEDWEQLWAGMPEFKQHDRSAFAQVLVSFRDREGQEEFYRLLGEKLGEGVKRTPTLWFPREEIDYYNKGKKEQPDLVGPNKYPIYIISKGRWESRKTSKALDRLGIPYRLVVEPQEYKHYRRAVGDGRKILTLPFSNLGQGSIPARNWVWEHAISEGHARHWILDDNINNFWRLRNNLKLRVVDENPFRPVEDFTDRFENVAMSGMNYFMFASRKTKVPPFYLNTRVYSCILLRNDLPHRWRGRYNEDTDLSLRFLKDGLCTILLNAFLAEKTTTMTMTGGNTDDLYKQNEEMDGRRLMAESLREQHPDVTTVTYKWGRWQHHVDYRPFKRNRLKPASEGLLLQEELRGEDPWRLLVACILMNKTTGKRARLVLTKLLSEWPDARRLAEAPEDVLEETIAPLGLQERRGKLLREFSASWVVLGENGLDTAPLEAVAGLPGVGEYALDSYRIFVLGEVMDPEDVSDRELRKYLERERSIRDRYELRKVGKFSLSEEGGGT